jgi:hypothetical protein
VPHTPARRMSQANSLTMALTAQILRAHGLLPPAEEPLGFCRKFLCVERLR